MKKLEISLGEDIDSRREVLKNFVGRVVIVKHPEFYYLKGKIISCKEDYFELRKPINDVLAFLMDTIYDVTYDKMQSLSIVNPTTPDYINEERRSIIKSNHAF
jgi:hypothetical protein